MARFTILSLLGVLIVSSGFTQTVLANNDPTAPLSWQAPAKKKAAVRRSQALPKLQSIVCSTTTECHAILNDKILTSGEWISGYQVKSINKDIVTLAKKGKQWKLGLFNSKVKQ